MQQEHRDILRRNYVTLIKETPVEVVVDHLYQNGTLTDELREDILQNNNSYSKVRQLISTLHRRGNKAFGNFCLALKAAGKASLVNLLDPEMETKTSKNLCMLPVGGDIFVVACEWRDTISIHIRKYEKNSSDC